MARGKALLAAVAGLAALLGQWACGAAFTDGGELTQVRYRLEWSEASRGDGAPRRFVNDLGYEITLTRGYLAFAAITLVPCETASLFSLRSARANHGFYDPSLVEWPVIDDLLAPEARDLGGRSFPQRAYCRVHNLIAAPAGDAIKPATPLDLSDTALYLEGTWRAPGGQSGALRIKSGVSNGGLLPLQVPAGASSVRVTIRRDVTHLFDGVDPRGGDDVARDLALLDNLLRATEISVEPIG